MNEIDQVFMQALGRAPNAQEMDFFRKLIQAGDIQPYEISQVLQGHPEAQQARLKSQGAEYESMLAGADQRAMDQGVKSAIGQFAAAGRDSSGLSNAAALSMQNLASQRQSALAAFYGKGLGDISQNYAMGGQNAMQRAYGLGDERRQWAREDQLYARQKDDYMGMFNQQQNANFRNALIGGGMGIMAAGAGGAAGGMFGYGGKFGQKI